jgi:hypothetical protein
MIPNMRLYIFFGIRSPTLLKSNIYVRTTPQGSSSHVLKDFALWGSLIKDYKASTMVFTIISTFFFLKASYSYMILLQVLITTNNTNLLKANYELLEGKKKNE